MRDTGHGEIAIRCPLCGKNKSLGSSCSLNVKKDVFHCFHCDKGGGAALVYSELHGVSMQEAANAVRRMEFHGGSVTTTDDTDTYEEQCTELADIEIRHDTYTKLLSLLRLDEKHREDLIRRGLDENDLPFYATIDTARFDEQRRIASVLLKSGAVLKGVPGFYKDREGYWVIARAKRGILVPYRDHRGMIQGLQIRKDEESIVHYKDGSHGSKYTWLSSKRVPKGCGSGTGAKTFLHYATTFFQEEDGRIVPFFPGDYIILTEGGMKADIFHRLSGKPALAIPGVNAGKALRKELRFLKSKNIRTIYLEFDMDYEENESVAKAMEKTRRMIKSEGLWCRHLPWDTKGGRLKGIDDYYAYIRRGILPGEKKKEA